MNPPKLDPIELWTLRFCAAAAPLAALLAPLGFSPLLAILGVALLVPLWRYRPWRQRPGMTAILFLATIGWSAVTAPWALDPIHSLRTAAGFLGVTLSGLLLCRAAGNVSKDEARGLGLILAASLAVCLVYLIFERVTCGAGVRLLRGVTDFCGVQRYVYKRPLTVLVLLCLPLGAFALRWPDWRRAALVIIPGLLAFALWVGAGAGLMAMAAAFVAAAACRLQPRLSVRALGLLVVAVIIAAPFAAGRLPDPESVFRLWTGMPSSVHHRLTIWKFAAENWKQKPVVGWGLDSARDLPGGDKVIELKFYDDTGRLTTYLAEQLMPLHPHNFALQWWLELGAVGAALLSGLVWTVSRRIAAMPKPATALAVFAGSTVVSAASFGAWQTWWLSAMWILAALTIMAGRQNSAEGGAAEPTA